MSLCFMHAADLHLGSGFSGIEELPTQLQQRVIDASLTAFRNLVDTCLEKTVDFLVLAGDVFESAQPSLHTQKYFVSQMSRLHKAEIEVFMVTGNHDANLNLVFPTPNNLILLPSNKVRVYERNYGGISVNIAGISYAQPQVENLSDMFPAVNEQKFNLAILHCDVGGSEQESYSPVSLQKLASKKYDYWAIGHVHSEKKLSQNYHIQYPGILQGRHCSETGDKGAFLIRVESGKSSRFIIHSKFIVLQDITWDRVDIDLSDTKPEQLEAVIVTKKEMYRSNKGRGTMLQIILSGTTTCHKWLKQPEVVEDLQRELQRSESGREDFVWIANLIDKTSPAINWKEIRTEGDFVSEVVLYLEEMICSGAKTKLDPIFEDITTSYAAKLEYKQILCQAKQLAVEVLTERRDIDGN